MIIFLAPSKTFTNVMTANNETKILFPQKNNDLLLFFKSLSKDDIKSKMKLSEKVTNEVFSYYNSEQVSVPAIYRFGGTVYKYLDPQNLYFKNNQLYIIDTFYGLLRPYDSIIKYRADFTMKFDLNFISFWKDTIQDFLIKNHKNDYFIDLASKEFSQLLPDELNLIRIEFRCNGKMENNMNLKKLRGLFANRIINSNIGTFEDIKLLTIDDYIFDKNYSNHLVYTFNKTSK